MNTFAKTALASIVFAFASVAAQAHMPTPRIDAHEAHQHQRIAQGVASGQLTHREAAHLRAEQRAIHRAEWRAKADGVVTPAERRHLAHMQQRASRHIYNEKHDAQVRP